MAYPSRASPALTTVLRTSLVGSTGCIGRLVTARAERAGIAVVPRSSDGGARRSLVLAVPEDRAVALVAEAVADDLDVIVPTADPAVIRTIRERSDEAARRAGVRVLVGVGWDPLVADLLAARASESVPGDREVHVAYALPGARLRGRSPGERRAIAERLGTPFQTLVAGERVEERDGETRRLAWFPRPVGPCHAAAVPGATVETVPVHVPRVATVRAYRALTTAAAEGRQTVANLARSPAVAELARRIVRSDTGPDEGRRAQQRWACVVEVAGGDVVSRAWAYGHDHLDLTALALVQGVRWLAEHEVAPGVRVPGELGDPTVLLDDLAARSDLRWGRARSVRPPA